MRLQLGCLVFLAAVLALLAGCASPITAKVTSFHVWPADTAGQTFSFVAQEGKAGELEHATYEGYVAAELVRLGLKPAPAGQVGRFRVDLQTTGTTREKKVLEPVYDYRHVFVPPTRDAAGNVFPGYWAPDQYGVRYIGDREVTRTFQVSRLRLRLLDAQAGSAAQPRAVFEATSVYEGDNEDLADLVPYLVRAAFDGFPGANGRVRQVRFDPKSGAVIRP